MFQIETALLKFDDMSESSDKTSVVKRYILVFNKHDTISQADDIKK